MKIRKGTVLVACLLGILALSGCNDFQEFREKLNLTDEEAQKAKPIIETYLKQQNAIMEEVKNQRPPNGGNGPMGGPPPQQSGRNNASQDRPNDGQRGMSEIEKKFNDNDQWAIDQLKAFLSPEQVQHFKEIAIAYRQKKMQQMMGGGGRPPQGGPGPRGGF
jgi:hypothetical protein